MRPAILFAAVALAGCQSSPPPPAPASLAGAGPVERGRQYAEAVCSRCHAIARTGRSPVAAAPAFRDLHRRYPVENLEEALGEGIVVGHPLMPRFELEAGQIADLVAYLKSLEPGAGAPPG
jgi:mono/diheme cytochrome c family protein